MTFETLLLVATVSCLGMISPGPDFFLVVKNSLSYSRRAALMTCFGVIVGIMTHMTYCIAGIAVLIKTTPIVFLFLRYAGAAYLIWLGIKALLAKAGSTTYIGRDQQARQVTLKKSFMQGYLCNLLNPKATMFFLAIFTQVIALDSSVADKFLVAFIIVIEAVTWWPMVVIIFQTDAVQRRYFKVQVIIDKLLGVVLIALGLKVALGI